MIKNKTLLKGMDWFVKKFWNASNNKVKTSPLRIFAIAYLLIATQMVLAQDAIFQQQLKLANQGNAAAQNYVGESYAYEADNVKPSYEKADHWLRKSAAQGYIPAIYNLGRLHNDDSLLLQAAEQGNVDAQIRVANMYRNGYGVAKDSVKAMAFCRKAAEQQEKVAYACMANMFYKKEGVSNEVDQAIIWSLKSIKIGNFDDAIYLRYINKENENIFQTFFQRVRKSADLNDASAQLVMATLYRYEVLGKSEDNKVQAVRWARMSAEQGYIQGQNFLGSLYKDGYEVPQDLAQAASWYLKGANQGDASAVSELRYIFNSARTNEEHVRFKKIATQDYQMNAHHLNREKSRRLVQSGVDFGAVSQPAPAPAPTPPHQIASVIVPQPVPKPVPAINTQQRRIALVIGNSAYQKFSKLENPRNDAVDMAARLKQLGFVLVGGGANMDVSQQQMSKLVGDFGASLAKNDLAVFYYAGHGAQIDGSNYLIPVNDVGIAYQEDVRSLGFNASHVLQSMEERQEGTNILILDACRDNPLPSRRATRSTGTRGLAKMQGSLNTVVLYAAKPGQAAQDGTGRNGVFTGALLSALSEPGLELTQVFRRVVKNVDILTKRDQTPWMEGATTDDIYLIGVPSK